MLNYSVNQNIYSEAIDDDLIIFSTESEIFFTFNSVGARICELILGNVDYDAIINIISENYNISTSTAAKDVDELLNSMIDKRILLAGEA